MYLVNLTHVISILKIHPSMKPHCQGKPMIKCEATASMMVSARHGEKARSRTPRDSRFRATGSRPSPARMRITARARFLQGTSMSRVASIHNVLIHKSTMYTYLQYGIMGKPYRRTPDQVESISLATLMTGMLRKPKPTMSIPARGRGRNERRHQLSMYE